MRFLVAIMISIFMLTTTAFSLNSIERAKVISNKEDKITVEVTFSKNAKNVKSHVDFTRNIVQLTFDNVGVNLPQIVHVNDKELKKIFAYQYNSKEARTRLIMNDGIDANNYKGKVSVKTVGNKVKIEIAKNKKSKSERVISSKEETIPETKIENKEKIKEVKDTQIDVKTVAAAPEAQKSNSVQMTEDEKEILKEVVAKDAVENKDAKTQDATKIETAKVEAGKIDSNKIENKKSDPEVLIAKAETDEINKQKSEATFLKMLISLFVVLTFMGILAYCFKKYISTGKLPFANLTPFGNGSKKGKFIEVIATHHLSPKKNIQLIKVMDEYMVIGVADENISLISKLGKDVNFGNVVNIEDGVSSFEKELLKKIREDNSQEKVHAHAQAEVKTMSEREEFIPEEEFKMAANDDVMPSYADFKAKIKNKVSNLKPLG